MLDAVLLFPLGGEEDNGTVEAVVDEDGVGGFFVGLDVSDDPGAAGVGERGENCLYAVFIAKAVLHDFELQLADGAEDEVSLAFVGF